MLRCTKESRDNMAFVCLDDFENFALQTLPKNALDYYRSGANDQTTLRDNIEAFKRWKILPRMLCDVSERDLCTTVLGHPVSFPVCIAPTAMHKMAHADGEVATAKGAYAAGTAFTLSTIATSSIEDIAAGCPDVLRFFQLYIYRERDVTKQLVRRAEQAGFKALILTVDTPFFGKRLADNRNKFKLPLHLKMANFEGIDFKSSGVSQSKKESGLNEYASSLFDPSLKWEDIKWLRSITSLPIVVKGVLTGDDAERAAAVGVDGIVVSNHGARQLDTVPSTIDALSEVVAAVKGRCEVYLDGGVRLGTDVFKAIALGARAVFIGRPAVYSLAYNGADGVAEMLGILKEEFSAAMAFSGCRSVSEIDRSYVKHEAQYLAKL